MYLFVCICIRAAVPASASTLVSVFDKLNSIPLAISLHSVAIFCIFIVYAEMLCQRNGSLVVRMEFDCLTRRYPLAKG